jgi:dolichol-phosphate mannosyltransferase
VQGGQVDDALPCGEAHPERICVVVPAFNVERHIAEVISGIPALVSDIVVVDDASRDNTVHAVERLSDPRITLVKHDRNVGVGGAMRTGYQRALELGADLIVKIDGDGQMNPTHLPLLVEPVVHGEADYTKGNRFLHTAALSLMPRARRVGNVGLSFLTKAASGYWDVFDPTNGYTAIHSRALRVLDWDRLDARWFFETSMLIELGRLRAVVRDVYVPARYAGESSALSEGRALISFPLRLFRATLARLWLRYFVTDFSALSIFLVVGLPLLLFGAAWGIYHWYRSAATGVESSTGTVMIAVLPLIVGTQLLLQAIVIDVQNIPRSPISNSRFRHR